MKKPMKLGLSTLLTGILLVGLASMSGAQPASSGTSGSEQISAELPVKNLSSCSLAPTSSEMMTKTSTEVNSNNGLPQNCDAFPLCPIPRGSEWKLISSCTNETGQGGGAYSCFVYERDVSGDRETCRNRICLSAGT